MDSNSIKEKLLPLFGKYKRNDIDVVVLNTTKNIVLLDEIIRGGTVLVDILKKGKG